MYPTTLPLNHTLHIPATHPPRLHIHRTPRFRSILPLSIVDSDSLRARLRRYLLLVSGLVLPLPLVDFLRRRRLLDLQLLGQVVVTAGVQLGGDWKLFLQCLGWLSWFEFST